MNNKTNIIAKTLIAGLACVAFCGTLTAAPRNGGNAPRKAPTHQTAPATNHNRAPQVRNNHHKPVPHGAPVAHHAPAPAHHHHEPPHDPSGRCRGGLRPVDIPAHHHGGHHEDAGWVALGATVIGGIVGGIIGACN